MTTLIEVHGLMTRFSAHLAVDDVGFTASEGEIFGILSIHRIENKFGFYECTFASGRKSIAGVAGGGARRLRQPHHVATHTGYTCAGPPGRCPDVAGIPLHHGVRNRRLDAPERQSGTRSGLTIERQELADETAVRAA